jgi:hypothetical protein
MQATPELQGAVSSGTAGWGANRDHCQRLGSRSYVSTHAHLGTACSGTPWEPLTASGQEELHESERTYASTYAYLGTAGREWAGGSA